MKVIIKLLYFLDLATLPLSDFQLFCAWRTCENADSWTHFRDSNFEVLKRSPVVCIFDKCPNFLTNVEYIGHALRNIAKYINTNTVVVHVNYLSTFKLPLSQPSLTGFVLLSFQPVPVHSSIHLSIIIHPLSIHPLIHLPFYSSTWLPSIHIFNDF